MQDALAERPRYRMTQLCGAVRLDVFEVPKESRIPWRPIARSDLKDAGQFLEWVLNVMRAGSGYINGIRRRIKDADAAPIPMTGAKY